MAAGIREALGSAIGWLRPQPVRDEAALAAFLGSRAAHVSQSVLFGYLKARMGTQYRELFQDPAYVPAIEAAQERVFVACLEDLTVYAFLMIDDETDTADAPAWMVAAAPTVALKASRHAEAAALPAEAADRIAERLRSAGGMVPLAEAFSHSVAVVIAAAPVSERYRAADGDIVDASMRYRWIEVQRQMRRRFDPGALVHALAR